MKVVAIHTIHRRPNPDKPIEIIAPKTEFEVTAAEYADLHKQGAVVKAKDASPTEPEVTSPPVVEPVIEPVVEPVVELTAKHQGAGKWAVVGADGEPLVKGLESKDAAAAWISDYKPETVVEEPVANADLVG